MEMPTHAINWFEIPVTDFERARDFYSKIYDYDMPTTEMGGTMMGFLLFEQGQGVGGAICKGQGYEPSQSGARLYLNGGDDLGIVLDRVEDAGGKVVMKKTQITPEIGYFGTFLDTEGNLICIHSMT